MLWVFSATHCHLEGGQFLDVGVDDSLVNGVRLRQVDHFAAREQDVCVSAFWKHKLHYKPQ